MGIIYEYIKSLLRPRVREDHEDQCAMNTSQLDRRLFIRMPQTFIHKMGTENSLLCKNPYLGTCYSTVSCSIVSSLS